MTQPTKAALEEVEVLFRYIENHGYGACHCMKCKTKGPIDSVRVIATALTAAEERGRKAGEERIRKLQEERDTAHHDATRVREVYASCKDERDRLAERAGKLREALEAINGPHQSQHGEDYTDLEFDLVTIAAKALAEDDALAAKENK